MSAATTARPFFQDETSDEYHADTAYVSHSALDEIRNSIPRYHGLYVAKTIERDRDSSALALGSAVHALVLQPAIANDLIVLWPEGDGKKTEVKQARDRVCAAAGHSALPKVRTVNGRMIVTKDEWDEASKMADSARKHPLVKELVEMDGFCEQSVRVVHPEFGQMKARFDKLFPAGHVLEIKTTRRSSPEAFSRDTHAFGYHRQAAFYEDVRDLALGAGQGIFLFVTICSIEPYETIVYRLEPSAIEVGRNENQALLIELNARRRAKDWSSRWGGMEPRYLDLPHWAYPKDR